MFSAVVTVTYISDTYISLLLYTRIIKILMVLISNLIMQVNCLKITRFKITLKALSLGYMNM